MTWNTFGVTAQRVPTVRWSADEHASRVRRCRMTKTSVAYADSWVCTACGARLMPLTPLLVDGHERPNLKCPQCGQAYRVRESSRWPPAA